MTSLLVAGIVCMVAAIVGGGVRLLGAELPVLDSFARQAILFAVGVLFLLGSFWVSSANPTSAPTPTQPLVPPPRLAPSPAQPPETGEQAQSVLSELSSTGATWFMFGPITVDITRVSGQRCSSTFAGEFVNGGVTDKQYNTATIDWSNVSEVQDLSGVSPPSVQVVGTIKMQSGETATEERLYYNSVDSARRAFDAMKRLKLNCE